MQFMPILSLLFYEVMKLLINNGTMTAAIYWRQLYLDSYILLLYILDVAYVFESLSNVLTKSENTEKMLLL